MFYSVSIMERVGIRDLKQNASAVVKRVEAGETVEITARWRALGGCDTPAPTSGWWRKGGSLPLGAASLITGRSLPSQVGLWARRRWQGLEQVSDRAVYIDSSAFMKLVIEEPETIALRR